MRYFIDQFAIRWLSFQFQIRLDRKYKIRRPDVGLRTRDLSYQANNHRRYQLNQLFQPGSLSSSPLTTNPSAPIILDISISGYGRDKQSAL